MLGPPLVPWLMTLCWGALQGAPIDGTWELGRIFRSGPTAASHTIPIDSTVYLRLTLKTMPGDALSRDAPSRDESCGAVVRRRPVALPDVRAGAARGAPHDPAAAHHPAVRADRRTARPVGVAPRPRGRHLAPG